MRIFTSCVFMCSVLFLVMANSAIAQSVSQSGSGLSSKSGKSFNPDIGANFLGLLERSTALSTSRAASPHNGLSLQEAEFQFTSDVDPYLRAAALFSVSQEDGSSGFGIDPEEVYVETISLPYVTVRAGKFKLAMGKHNQLHTHAYPFIDAPLIHTQLLGDEGLNEAAVSAAILLPLSWYSELTLQGFNPSNTTQFNSPSSGNLGSLAHFKNLFDLNDDLTMEIGGSYSMARNSFDKNAKLYGGDLTFKWRPAEGGKYHALIWSSEYLQGYRPGNSVVIDDTVTPNITQSTEHLGGVATWLQYQLAERWWAQARYEYIGWPSTRSDGFKWKQKESALVGFFSSEFSGLRLQYDRLKTQFKGKLDHAIAFQYNISIGAHPAHAY